MLITVSDLPIVGKHFELDFTAEEIEPIDGVKYLMPVHFSGDLYRSGTDVRIVARITTQLEVECSRCLEIFAYNITASYEVFYRPFPHNTPKEADVPFGELGILYYRDNQINLAESTRDTIILEIPMKLLCKESCRGLCMKCGQNLNVTTCACQEEHPKNNPFAEFFANAEQQKITRKNKHNKSQSN